MKQKDIERVMSAAWAAVSRQVGPVCPGNTREELRGALAEVDPHGVYRPGAPQSALTEHEAGTHE